MTEDVRRQLREGLGERGYARSDDGVLWETYVGEDVVVQCPPSDTEQLYVTDLIPRAVFLFTHAAESGARVPEVLEYSQEPPSYLALRRIRGQSLSAFVGEAGEDATLEAVESAGELLGQLHAADGFGYGSPEAHAYRQASHDTWRAFARGIVEQAAEYTAGGPFEPVVSELAEGFDPRVVPERPPSRLLHGDFSADNVIIDGDRQAWAIDFDNALYGDSRYDFVRARDRLAGDDPREQTYARLLGSTHDGGNVLTDRRALAAFERGYERAHELALEEPLERQYERLAMVKSAQDGEWIRRNRELSIEEWVTGLREWYRSRFG